MGFALGWIIDWSGVWNLEGRVCMEGIGVSDIREVGHWEFEACSSIFIFLGGHLWLAGLYEYDGDNI